MSYENPRYINESQADLFQNLQNTINQAVLTSKKATAQEEYRKEVYNNETILQGQNASANTITDQKNNQTGSQVTIGKTDKFFNNYKTNDDGSSTSYAARAKEITMELRKKPRPDNYEELQAELDWIDRSPEVMKTGITNMASQFNIDNLNNIDKTMGSDVLLAAMIFNEQPGYGSGNGFDYEMRPGKVDGTIDFVFTGSGVIPPGSKAAPTEERRKEIEKLLDEDPTREDAAELQEELDATGQLVSFGGEDGYTVNSADLELLNEKERELIPRIPSVTKQLGAVQQDAGIFIGAEYNDRGELTNSGQFQIKDLDLIRMQGKNIAEGVAKEGELITTTFMDFDMGDGKTAKYEVWNIDKDRLRTAMQPSINNNARQFTDPVSGNVQKAVSYWNNRIAPSVANQTYDKDVALEAFGEFPEVARMEEGPAKEAYIKKKWQEAIGGWSHKTTKLNKYQAAMFNRMYTKQQVDAAYDEMMSPANARARVVDSSVSIEQAPDVNIDFQEKTN